MNHFRLLINLNLIGFGVRDWRVWSRYNLSMISAEFRKNAGMGPQRLGGFGGPAVQESSVELRQLGSHVPMHGQFYQLAFWG